MAERTVKVSDRDKWVIHVVVSTIAPKTFVEVRQLNRVYDAFGLEEWVKRVGKTEVGNLSTESVEVRCEEDAFNFLLKSCEPALAKLNPDIPLRAIASDILALHEKLSKT